MENALDQMRPHLGQALDSIDQLNEDEINQLLWHGTFDNGMDVIITLIANKRGGGHDM